jgi:tetratricopeptide (TPR) repeat protein
MENTFGQEFRDTLKRKIKSKSFFVSLGITVLLAIGCAFSGQAIINLLGYEFSMIVSLVVSQLIAGISAGEAAHIQRGIGLKKYRTSEFALLMFARILALSLILLLLLLLPLIIMLLNAFRVVNCNIMQGIRFYFLIPGLTGFVSMLLALSFTLFCRGRSRAGYLWFLLYSFSTIAVTMYNLYAGPRVSFYNFILGTLVLFNYNTVVSIDAPFLLSRSLSLVFGFLIFWLALLGYERNKSAVTFRGIFRTPFSESHRLILSFSSVSAIVWLVIIFVYRGSLGVDVSTSYLKKLMDGEKRGKGIILRYPSDSPIAGEMDRVLKEHEWHYQKIVEELQLKKPPLIMCYIYPTKQQKTRLTGVGGSVFAKPWQSQIHVEYSKNDINALKHELTHILAGEFGRPIVNISLQTGLCEGLSEAVEWEAGTLTHHQWAKEIIKGEIDHRASPVYTMRNDGFWSQRITVSYYISGSFVRWLIDTYGIEKFKNTFHQAGLFYSDKPYVKNYGKTLRELTEEWMAFLKTVPGEEKGTLYAQYMFQRPAFAEQRCSHEVAERAEKAQTALQYGQFKKALEESDALMKFQPDDPYHGWIKLSALIGLEKYDEAMKLSSDLMAHPKSNEGYKAQLIWRRAFILAKQERWLECRLEVQKTIDNSIADWMTRDSMIKLAVLNHKSEEVRRLMFRALDPDETDTNFYLQQVLAIDPAFWPATYLIGRRLNMTGEYDEAVIFLKRFLAMDNIDSMFRKEGDLSLIEAAFRSEQYPLAYNWTFTVFEKSYKLSEAEKVLVLKWRDRIEWTWNDRGKSIDELKIIELDNNSKMSETSTNASNT